MMACEIEQVRLHCSADARIDVHAALRPVRAAGTVEFDQLLLRLEHERGEARLAIGFSGLAEQERRLRIERLSPREGTVDLRTVLKALLLDVEVAQR